MNITIEIEGNTYYTALEAAKYLGVSRETFYKDIRGKLKQHKNKMSKRIYYSGVELDNLKKIRPVEEIDQEN